MAKFTLNQILDLYQALTDLRGSPIVVKENGQAQVVYEPYPLSDKARWNAGKNRAILKRYVQAHEELVQDDHAILAGLKRTKRAEWISEKDVKERNEKREAASQAIQEAVDEMNVKTTQRGRVVEEVDGLLTIPAEGLCLKSSKIPPSVISELMVLIDGEPKFDPEPAPAGR